MAYSKLILNWVVLTQLTKMEVCSLAVNLLEQIVVSLDHLNRKLSRAKF